METLSFDKLPVMTAQLLDKVSRIETLLTKPTEPQKPTRFDFNGALDYFKSSGFIISPSKLQKLTALGDIPCKKFNNRLVFIKCELDAWVESKTISVGSNSDDAALTLAKSANRKLRGGN